MSDAVRINNYANSMFRHEVLHAPWISKCEQYLKYVFGEQGVEGRTVVDYAFGRGNWAVAFSRSGAKKVIAIDASEDNCKKLRNYCESNGIVNIEVICGNLVEKDLDFECEIVWLYGILHHIAMPDIFLERLLEKVAADGVVLAYTYNANSLREWVVTTARKFCLFESEHDFRSHSFWFTPAARLRARDDLVAPCINWDDSKVFAQRFDSLGWKPVSQLIDFAPWLHGFYSGEFNPYVVKFLRSDSAVPIEHQEDSLSDLTILRAYSDLIVQKLPQTMHTSFAVGLFNTHFHSATDGIHASLSYETNGQIVWENFKYLVYAAAELSIDGRDFSPSLAVVWNAVMCSLKGEPSVVKSDFLSGSLILEKLSMTTMRI